MNHFSRNTLTSKIFLQKPEIVLICDKSIFVHVNHLESNLKVIVLRQKVNKWESILDSLNELWQIHDPLLTPVIHLFAMQTLDSNLSEMLLHAEVDKLVVLDAAVPIVVVPKNVFYKVVHLRPILLQDSLQKLPYLVLLKLLVVILVEFNQL